MTAAEHRIESTSPMADLLLPVSGAAECLDNNVDMAVVTAAKNVTIPFGQELRVVHVPTGEIVFRKSAAPLTALHEDD